MKNAKYVLNMVAAFSFSVLLTLGKEKHTNLLWLFALAVLPLGVWLMRSNPPWWHGSSTMGALAAGRLCTNAWLNARHMRSGPAWDDFVWIFVAITLFLFLTEVGKLPSRHSKSQSQGPG